MPRNWVRVEGKWSRMCIMQSHPCSESVHVGICETRWDWVAHGDAMVIPEIRGDVDLTLNAKTRLR